jgi:hypothetical protein
VTSERVGLLKRLQKEVVSVWISAPDQGFIGDAFT